MNLYDKLTILTESAKYDVSCSSSGVERGSGESGDSRTVGNTAACGSCHSFAADGRCISLLKLLMSNACIYDCKYCVNRRSNDTRRAAFTPEELAELTMHFYRRNYVEGLFLSSGIMRSPDYTTEQLIRTLELLRNHYGFGGYVHVKAIPGADPALIARLGLLADRMSVNIELPSQDSLHQLAPDKNKEAILKPMRAIRQGIRENGADLVKYRNAPRFVPGGQSTQLIIGATPDSDLSILNLTEALYRKYELKRVYYSAYTPVAEHALLPSLDTKPPLLREHRLYQADWLLRFYGFEAQELLDERTPNFNLFMDPKCHWALQHIEYFPVEVNTAPYETLLRVPGIGVRSAKRIVAARRTGRLDFHGLKKLGVVLKRAQYFLTCSGHRLEGLKVNESTILRSLLSRKEIDMYLPQPKVEQLSLFSDEELAGTAGREIGAWLLG
ncbi:MAG: putative DNA modification/repair radical SAM protein [Paenibacillus sp.]|uniref:putative DNA modification/repair radical SAM protein n=1 Tax=Paenibacillus sp. TaxID=58172 RepID=UPI002906A9A0|nr:putative DNA modification/repair radical SAM protein [Paenibacillus sp.]MDU4698029.1 putative DNA modification/repair radical SAM protein [Paenibacillus sp.]